MSKEKIILVSDMNELKNLYIAPISLMLQVDFGASWSVDTASEDDLKAFAVALAVLREFNILIVSEDEKVMSLLKELKNNQFLSKYANYMKKGGE